jgi:hypothetical protein
MLMIDFSACVYESSDGAMKEGKFLYHGGKAGFSLKSDLSGPGYEKLVFQFKQCIGSYLSFMRDPSRFLRVTPYFCLFDKQSGSYATLWSAGNERLFWLTLKPTGQALMSCVAVDEAEREVKKWAFITKPPESAAAANYTDGNPFMPQAVSFEAFGAFLLFLTRQKGRYEFLFKNSMDRYRDVVTPINEVPNPERALRNEASPLLRIDYKTCVYESLDPAIPGGNFTYAYESPDFRVAAPVAEELNKELAFQFRECLPHYFTFIENPFGFLRYHAYSSLFDKKSDGYALFTQEGKIGKLWHFLKPNGQVFSAFLNVRESEKEAEKWQYVVELPDERNIEVAESKPYRPNINSLELFSAFYKFMKLHEKHYNSLFKATAEQYKALVSLPSQRTPVPRDTDSLEFFMRDERR